jgi:transposase
LAVLPDRLQATLIAWLESIPEAIRAAITTVCTDIWEGYISAVEQMLPGATIVLDRFHVARHYREAVDELRKQEMKRLKKELSKEEIEEIKHTLWPLRKRGSDLEQGESERLERLFSYSPALRKAYELREQLTAIFDTARSKKEAKRRMG